MVSLCLLLLSASLVSGFKIQKPGLTLPPDAIVQREQVKQLFTNAFSAYTEFAFGHDDLQREWAYSQHPETQF